MILLTQRQLEIVNALIASRSGADMEAWCIEHDVSSAEFNTAMVTFDKVARAQGLYYNQ